MLFRSNICNIITYMKKGKSRRAAKYFLCYGVRVMKVVEKHCNSALLLYLVLPYRCVTIINYTHTVLVAPSVEKHLMFFS